MGVTKLFRTAAIGLCATSLIAAPALVAPATARPTADKASHSITIVAKGKNIVSIKGTAGLTAGRVSLQVKGRADSTVTIVSFAKGYSYKKLVKAFLGSFGPNPDLKALRTAIRKTNFIGGIAAGSSGTIVLPKAGTYTTFILGERGPGKPKTFTAGAKTSQPKPDVDGRIVAKTGARWGGSTHLPHKGTLEFKNASTDSPHFLVLIQVGEGTTTDQVLEYLQAEPQGPPPWALEGELETDVISPGNALTLDYKLPKGQYVALCFFPDVKMGGMPHALMGMLKMYHLG